MISLLTGDERLTQVNLAEFAAQSHVIASMELKENEVVPLPLIPTTERLQRLINQDVGCSIQESIDTANDADYLHHSLLNRCCMHLSRVLETENVEDVVCKQLVPELLQRIVSMVVCRRMLAFHASSMEQMSDNLKWIVANSDKMKLEKIQKWRLEALLVDYVDWTNDTARAAYNGDIDHFRSLPKLPGKNSFCWSIALLKGHMEIVHMGVRSYFDLARHVAKSADEAVWQRLGKDYFLRLTRNDCRALVRESVQYSNVISYTNFQRIYRERARMLLPLNEFPSLCYVEIDGELPELTVEAQSQEKAIADDDSGFISFDNYMSEIYRPHNVCTVDDIIFKPNIVRKLARDLRESDREVIRARGQLFESMRARGDKLWIRTKTVVGYVGEEACPITDKYVAHCEETLQILNTMCR